ncbi:MAG: alcohol dehydrogenase catalytic domain-containing protein [Lachnospiraceae bacterium]|nr:alcohol dehydrogenase catalytic domain-containing protein [Lachnospiraceae bacterium]
MKCMLTCGAGIMEYSEKERPAAGPGEAVIKVRAASVCGGDVTRYKSAPMKDVYVIPGHEFSGDIVEIRDGGERYAVGDRVCIFPNPYCGTCPECRAGRFNLCTHKKSIGNNGQNGPVDGGMAEYCKVPVRSLIKLDDSVSYEQGALVEPVAVGLHASRAAGDVRGQKVLVYGAGAIGLYTIMFLKMQGAERIYALDVLPEHLEMAERYGADCTMLCEGNFAERIREDSGCGIDIVFDTVCLPPSISATQKLLRGGGSSVWIAIRNMQQEINIFPTVFHEQKIFTSFIYYKSEMEEAAGMMGRGEINCEDTITDRVPLSQGKALFEDLVHNPGAHIKAQFRID